MRYTALLAGALALTSGCYTPWSHSGVEGATWSDWPRYPSRPDTYDIREYTRRDIPTIAHDTISEVTMMWPNDAKYVQIHPPGSHSMLEILFDVDPQGDMEEARHGVMEEARRLGGDAVIYGNLCATRDETGTSPDLSHGVPVECSEGYLDTGWPCWVYWQAHVIRFITETAETPVSRTVRDWPHF